MRGKTIIISLATIFTIILVTSAVFASGLVNVPKLSLFGTPVYPNSPDSNIFIDPATKIGDHVNDPGYQEGNLIQVHVNITGAVDLFSYQVNVTWSPTILNFTRIVSYGDLLAKTGSSYGTSRIEPTWKASNVTGYASIAETILGDVTGISGNGRLFTIEFKIVGYGATWIRIGTGGTLPTTLLESTGATHAYTTTDGYFRNALSGDANLDKTIDVFDILAVKSRWGRTPASPDWIREYDVNDDKAIDVFDILTVKANWGRTTP
jgi:hypothetical protein